jgi:2-polyprenyl-6-hydroxyphenyl methylase/3-demethylubiquinone-9 3-methyltransferase
MERQCVRVWDVTTAPARPRNDPRQYDDLAGEWWDPFGQFAMLHWIAAARGALIPAAERLDAVLVDLGCGAGLLAPHVPPGYRHIGVDITASALDQATAHGVIAVRADVTRLPFPDESADVVSAGEILEHVRDLDAVVGEACRVLRPGGLLVLDTIADTMLARVLAVHVAERIPGGAPVGIHDPALFVNRRRLIELCARHGVRLALRGLRPSLRDVVAWRRRLSPTARMVPSWSTAVLFQGRGIKECR